MTFWDYVSKNPEQVATVIAAIAVVVKAIFNKYATEKQKGEVAKIFSTIKGYNRDTQEFKAALIAATGKTKLTTNQVVAIAEELKGPATIRKKIQRIGRKLLHGWLGF